MSSMAAVLAVFTVTVAPMSAAVANDKDPTPTASCGQWMNNPIFDETILFGGRWRSMNEQEIEGSIEMNPRLPEDYEDHDNHGNVYDGSLHYPDDKWRARLVKTEEHHGPGDGWDALTELEIRPGRIYGKVDCTAEQLTVQRDATVSFNRDEEQRWISSASDPSLCPAQTRRCYLSSRLVVMLNVQMTVAIDAGDHASGISQGGGVVENSALGNLQVRDDSLAADVLRSELDWGVDGRVAAEANGGVNQTTRNVGGGASVTANFSSRSQVASSGIYNGAITYTLSKTDTIDTADAIIMKEALTFTITSMAHSIDDTWVIGEERASRSVTTCQIEFATSIDNL